MKLTSIDLCVSPEHTNWCWCIGCKSSYIRYNEVDIMNDHIYKYDSTFSELHLYDYSDDLHENTRYMLYPIKGYV